MRMSSCLSFFQRFLRNASGTTVVEYALLLALVVGGGTLGYYSMDDTSRAMLTTLVDDISDGFAPSDHYVRSASSENIETASISQLFAGQDFSRMIQLCGWYIAFFAGVIILFLIRRHNKRRVADVRVEEKRPVEPAPIEQHRLFTKRQQIRTILSRDASMLFDSKIETRHFMSEKIVSVSASMPAPDVEKLMDEEMIRHVLVCDKSDRLLGIISDRDLTSAGRAKAVDLMTPSPFVISEDTPIGQAITTLLNKRISCLPIVKDGVPTGVLTTTDLLMSLQCVLQVLVRVAREVQLASEMGDDAQTDVSKAGSEYEDPSDAESELLEMSV